MEKAVIFNIMRYSVHDGPGIRTTVFFKGCPLSCRWCHNPESIAPEPEEVFNAEKCIHCGRCDNCPSGARETIGREISAAELMKEITKDLLFYEQSGGGVTFSGGEPFYQGAFLLEILARCKDTYINTAIDTSGFCDTETILKAAETADYFLYDIKFMNREKHEKYCGASNGPILENLKRLSETKTKLLIRIPVIPGINDGLAEMAEIAGFIKPFKNIGAVHLLPYHNIHANKYTKLGKPYGLAELSGEESPNMQAIRNLFSPFRIKTGG